MTDAKRIVRYLQDAEKFYRTHAATLREADRARQIHNMKNKLKKKLKYETI